MKLIQDISKSFVEVKHSVANVNVESAPEEQREVETNLDRENFRGLNDSEEFLFGQVNEICSRSKGQEYLLVTKVTARNPDGKKGSLQFT